MNSIEYKDYREEVKAKMRDLVIQWLHEACGELEAQTRRNQRVKTGKTKGSWRYVIDYDKLEGMVGSDSDNAVYEEFGTGEYALDGNGRKGGWWYKDALGKWHFTRGKRPCRALYHAYIMLQGKIMDRAKALFGGLSL